MDDIPENIINITEISCSENHSLVIVDGKVFAFGQNKKNGVLGLGNTYK